MRTLKEPREELRSKFSSITEEDWRPEQFCEARDEQDTIRFETVFTEFARRFEVGRSSISHKTYRAITTDQDRREALDEGRQVLPFESLVAQVADPVAGFIDHAIVPAVEAIISFFK